MDKRKVLQKIIGGQLSKKEVQKELKQQKKLKYVKEVIPQGEKLKLVFGNGDSEVITKGQINNDRSLYFPTKTTAQDGISDPIE